MKRIDWRPPPEFDSDNQVDPAAMQLAMDEAMLLECEAGTLTSCLRTWELTAPAVVLGRSSKADLETDRAYCDANGISIYRRCSGGASIVGGPGCLMYSVVISFHDHPHLAKIDAAHRHVMGHVLTATQRQLPDASLQGICDLTHANRKFSGNALRLSRNHVLYHGTILYDADLELIDRCLDHAPRQPDYRAGRNHRTFVTNAPLDPETLENDLADVFEATAGEPDASLTRRALELASKRYSCQDWSFRH